jgi:SAM-dependent methyltransferase
VAGRQEVDLMVKSDAEASVRSCYSTWGRTYFDEYYGPEAPYPPIHVDLVAEELATAGARTVLDAGCGPASMLRLLSPDLDRYGFDLTPEMVTEARRVLGEQGVPDDHVWEGSVLDANAFRAPPTGAYDAAVCIGVLPHIPGDSDATVLGNLHDAVRPGGRVVVEARNQLFALFTLNRYSRDLVLEELIPVDRLRAAAGDDAGALEAALDEVGGMFRNDLPPVRTGKVDEPGYDEVLSRTHNPLVLRDEMAALGFDDLRIRFYHWHALPPLAGAQVPALQRRVSLEVEQPDDWRGLVMASAFIVAGTRA